MALKIITPPAVEPVTRAEAKLHMRVDHDTEDNLIDSLIVSARQMAEKILGRTLITTTYELQLDGFVSWRIILPRPPLIAIADDAVKYDDLDNVEQTLAAANYTVDAVADPGRVHPAPEQLWPRTYYKPNAVRIRYTAGYGATAATVPAAIRQAILLCVAHWYESREGTMPTYMKDMPLSAMSILGKFGDFV